MKMNFKYAMMACAALAMGFSSCSNDNEADKGLEAKEKTMAVFTLNFDDATRALTATSGATDSEKAIQNAVLYVFSSEQSLEKTIAIASGNVSEVTEITTGTHFFLAAANFATAKLPAVSEGESMVTVKSKLVGAFAAMSEITAANNFYITSLKETSAVLAPNVTNPVSISVGRAMAKVNLSCDGGSVYNELVSTSATGGKLTNVKYMVDNNPVKMNFFPVYSGSDYTSAFYNETFAVANYFPVVDAAGTKLALKDPYATPADGASDDDKAAAEILSASYLMENANATPTKGNSSYLLISGTYTPAKWYNVDGTVVATAPADGTTFYRLYNVEGDFYYDNYFVAAPTQEHIKALDPDLKTLIEAGGHINAIEYVDGKCYYAFYLRNGANAVVKRNDYFNVVLNEVLSAGASLPNINGEGDPDGSNPEDYVPGTGGGDGDGDNIDREDDKDPIDGKTKIQGTITVLDWNVVPQTGGIGKN